MVRLLQNQGTTLVKPTGKCWEVHPSSQLRGWCFADRVPTQNHFDHGPLAPESGPNSRKTHRKVLGSGFYFAVKRTRGTIKIGQFGVSVVAWAINRFVLWCRRDGEKILQY
ncbi:hypothetical protein CEXT_223271 [Caerostris extrusa]|uniref:Uncharacterized protein n=1 Tax=Caerostris extrusa TaxID=172846 RepID=A0AAV4TJM4_CAEEX|nr:hypothetical protein CEXT_223271 [Caerostris extrusa]